MSFWATWRPSCLEMGAHGSAAVRAAMRFADELAVSSAGQVASLKSPNVGLKVILAIALVLQLLLVVVTVTISNVWARLCLRA